jgi:malate synthase
LDVKVTANDLLNTSVPGKITLEGIRENVSCCLAYTAAWVGGNGCIPYNYLMEDAATAEITRIQLWQWVKYGMRVDDTGEVISVEYVDQLIEEITPTIKKIVAGVKDENVSIAKEYLRGQIRKQWPSEFLTSDLMPILAVRDGVEPKFQQKASL